MVGPKWRTEPEALQKDLDLKWGCWYHLVFKEDGSWSYGSAAVTLGMPPRPPSFTSPCPPFGPCAVHHTGLLPYSVRSGQVYYQDGCPCLSPAPWGGSFPFITFFNTKPFIPTRLNISISTFEPRLRLKLGSDKEPGDSTRPFLWQIIGITGATFSFFLHWFKWFASELRHNWSAYWTVLLH